MKIQPLLTLIFSSLLLAACSQINDADDFFGPPALRNRPDPPESAGLSIHAVTVRYHPGGDLRVLESVVLNKDGAEDLCIECQSGWGEGLGMRAPSPSPESLTSPILVVLTKLPPSQPQPSEADTLTITWPDAGQWSTRTYDRKNLPPEVHNLCHLMDIRDN